MKDLWATLDENNNVIPCEEPENYALNMRTKRKHVGDDLINGYRVSTVFLGFDHGYDGIPKWFETMVFHKVTDKDCYCERYTTWKEAQIGHRAAIQWVLDGAIEDE